MFRLIFTFLIFSFALFSFGQLDTKDAQIVLNPEGHRGKIKSLFFSNDGQKLYSVSDDKTICVWDVASGNLINTIRGYREEGTLGMLNSGNIAPSGDFMVVGGMLGNGNSNTGQLRFVRPNSGEVIMTFNGLQSPVTSIDIANNSFIAAGTNEGTLGFINIRNPNDNFMLKAHDNGIYGIAFSPDSTTIVTGGYDGKVIAWDLKHMREHKEAKYTMHEEHTDKVRAVCYAPSGDKYYSVGYDNKIIAYSNTHEVVGIIDIIDGTEKTGVGDIHSIGITDDSKTLIVGVFQQNGVNAISYDLSTGKRKVEFRGNDNTVMALAVHGNDLVATAGGTDRDIYIWNPHSGKIISHLVGIGKRLYKVGFSKDNVLAIGMKPSESLALNNLGYFTHTFDLRNFELMRYTDTSNQFISEMSKVGRMSSGPQSLSQLKVSDGWSVATIDLDPGTQGNMSCYSITPTEEVVIGSNYALSAYGLDGAYLREYRGHVSDVHSVAFSADGRFMASASADQTVLIWDMTDTGKMKRTFEEFILRLNDIYGEEKIDKVIETKGIDALKRTYDATEKPEVFPIASLFISSEDDWILWTKDNYYASSKNGAQYVGFHYNQGFDSSALYYDFQQYDVVLNRPDKVLEILGTADENTIDLYKQVYQKRLSKLNLNEEQLASTITPPTLEVKTPNGTVTESYFGFNFIAMDNEGIAYSNATINGVPVFGLDGMPAGTKDKDGTLKSATALFNMLHTRLEPGLNKINIWCTNTLGIRSNVETRYVFFDTTEFKPDLYVLGIGVSDYAQSDYNLQYAAKDVQDFVKLYSPKKNYRKINVHSLLNEDATLENIKKAMSKLKQAKAHDHIIIYFAGHGVLTEELDYYLATHNMDFTAPKEKGLSYTYLEKEIADLKARNRVVFLDACHSGEVEKENISLENTDVIIRETRGAQLITEDVTKKNLSDLVTNTFTDLRKNAGATIIASAGGAEYAYEGDDWENGVFSYAVLSGLRDKSADLNGDGDVQISELQEYVSTKVNELTNGLQTPNARNENLLRDYVFW